MSVKGVPEVSSRQLVKQVVHVVFSISIWNMAVPSPRSEALQWRHNGHDGVSNHQLLECLFNHLFRRRSKRTSKVRVTGLCGGIHRGQVNSRHKVPVTRKMFPSDHLIMVCTEIILSSALWSTRPSVSSLSVHICTVTPARIVVLMWNLGRSGAVAV